VTGAGTLRIFTIGHSTRPLEAFLGLLRAFGITLLVDIRIAPSSRRHPQFGADALARALAGAGVGYLHLRALGGHRRPRPDSPHVGWRSGGFRGYADHMETAAFRAALQEVVARAAQETVALMCAEAVPWRCHRQLVADALVARGIDVVHILGPGQAPSHTLTPFARLEGTRVVYDAIGDLVPARAGAPAGVHAPSGAPPEVTSAAPPGAAAPGSRTRGTRRTGGPRGRPA